MNVIIRRGKHLREALRQDGLRGAGLLLYRHRMFREEKAAIKRKYQNMERMEEQHRIQADLYHDWIVQSFPDEQEKRRQSERRFSHQLTFLIPTYNTNPDMLKELAESLLQQTCGQWKAVLYDGASTKKETLDALSGIQKRDPRFLVTFGRENLGISGNTNRAIELVQTDCVALCDHDDLLTCDAVYWLLDAFENGADFCYSDEDKCDERGERFYDPHLKSDFAPDSLRSGNYICHLTAMTTKLMQATGGLRSEYDGSQDHDLVLRATEMAQCVAHVHRVLYHWRMVGSSFSHTVAERCARAAARAVYEQMNRQNLGGRAELDQLQLKMIYPIPSGLRVSLIVHGISGRAQMEWLCLLTERTGEDLERISECILICDKKPKAVPFRIRELGWKILCADSFSDAAQKATGDVLLFLEQGMLPQSQKGNWLHRGLMMATCPWIGQVGGGIVDRNANYLACGYAVDVPQGAVGCMRGDNSVGFNFQLYDRLVRNVSAVSSCYMMIRRSVFQKYHRFDDYSSDLRSAALGLECMQNHLYNVIVPHAVMRQSGRTQVLDPDHWPEDLERFTSAFGAHPAEHFFSPLFEKETGRTTVDLNRRAEAPTDYTNPSVKTEEAK